MMTAFPILMNPPNQFFERLLKIPASKSYTCLSVITSLFQGFGPKRVIFRTLVIAFLLVIGLSVPDFGAILDLIGSTTVTLLNFVFPPVFYLFLADKTKKEAGLTPR